MREKLGYRKAADLTRDSNAAALFHKYAVQSPQYSRELIPFSNMRTAEEAGDSPLSAVFRGWVELKSALTSYDTKLLYAWCGTGEEAAIKIYANAIRTPLPIKIQAIIHGQFAEIKEARGQMKDLSGK